MARKPTQPETEAPSCIKDGLIFFPIPEVSDAECVFGADIGAYFNRYDRPKVPHQYEEEVSRLFFEGGQLPDFQPDIDRAKAARFIKSRLRSFAPAHEAKTTTVAYAFWVWSTPADERVS